MLPLVPSIFSVMTQLRERRAILANSVKGGMGFIQSPLMTFLGLYIWSNRDVAHRAPSRTDLYVAFASPRAHLKSARA